jgi:hypothetical protein
MNWQWSLALAYRTVFLHAGDKPVPEGKWWQRLLAGARPTFGRPTPASEAILADLAYFCRANRPSIEWTHDGAIDPLACARLEGRREVWLRINEALHLAPEVILNLKEVPPE